MAGYPADLSHMLRASSAEQRDEAWESFIARHSRLVLSACRTPASDYDDVMDRYAYVLEQLQANDFSRLRAYNTNGRTKFTTWLIVVSQRLCVDYHRSRYGRRPRPGRGSPGPDDPRRARRKLVDLLASRIDPEHLPDVGALDAPSRISEREIRVALADAVARLSPDDQLLLALRFEHECSGRELADLMDLPTRFHAYRVLKRILAGLRGRLGEKGIDDATP